MVFVTYVVAWIFSRAGQENIYFSEDNLIFENAKGERQILKWEDIQTTPNNISTGGFKTKIIKLSLKSDANFNKFIEISPSSAKSIFILGNKYTPKNHSLLISLNTIQKNYK